MTAFDWQRLRDWAETPGRKPAHTFFTAGELRDAASAVENALRERDALAEQVRVLADAGAFAAAELERTRAERDDALRRYAELHAVLWESAVDGGQEPHEATLRLCREYVAMEAERDDARRQLAAAVTAANLVCQDRARLAGLLAECRRVSAEFRKAWDDYLENGWGSQSAQVRYDAAVSAVLRLAETDDAASGEGATSA